MLSSNSEAGLQIDSGGALRSVTQQVPRVTGNVVGNDDRTPELLRSLNGRELKFPGAEE
jgi:hypothetical protein